MLKSVTLPAKDLKDCFTSLSLVAAKGSQLTPVSLILDKNILKFNCLQGCVVQCHMPILNDEQVYVVIMYYDVTPIIPTDGEVTLSISSYDVSIEGVGFNCSFPLGYGSVEDYDFSTCVYEQISNKEYASGLRTLQGMNLDKIYGKAVPFSIYEGVSVIKHPCCYVQARTPGLPFVAQLDQEHIKMLTRFAPWEVSMSMKDTIVFRRKNAILQVPCRMDIPSNDFTSFLQDMQSKCVVVLGGLADKLRDASKVSTKSKCTVTGTKTGLQITTTIENASSSISVGDISGETEFMFSFPTQVLLTFFKAIGSGKVEILTGGDLICLRTQSLIILVRVDY